MTDAAIDQLLTEVRATISPRVQPQELAAERALGALLVDIRPEHQRGRDGLVPEAVVIDRNVLEWRLDPSCPYRSPEITGPDQRIILMCDEGFASSLAAATLRRLGLRDVTDLAGGVQAWLSLRDHGEPADRLASTRA